VDGDVRDEGGGDELDIARFGCTSLRVVMGGCAGDHGSSVERQSKEGRNDMHSNICMYVARYRAYRMKCTSRHC